MRTLTILLFVTLLAPGAPARAAADPAPGAAAIERARPVAPSAPAGDTLGVEPQWSEPIGPGATADPSDGDPRWSEPSGPGAERATGRAPIEWLWVTRGTLTSARKIDELVERARAMGVRGLLVQVIGRGDAWFESTRLPRAEALPSAGCRDCGPFDPLGELLPKARAAGLEVHAWVNALLVWSAPERPRDPRHVVVAHPEWVARLEDGRRLTQLTPEQRRELGIEGVFLNPAHPGVRRWLASAVGELVARYPLDGVHLDHIRQPGARVGFDPDTRARFALVHGADPARFERMSAARRREMEAAWSAFHLEQVEAVVREVADSARAWNPAIELSAAVLADTLSASRRAQGWPGWVREGLLSRVYVMCYAREVQAVLDHLAGYRREPGIARVVPGIAVYNTAESTAAAKIKGARALGYREVALYSYDALFERPDGWARLRGFLDDAPFGGMED